VYSPPTIPFATLKKLYTYDQSSFLDAVLTNQTRPGTVIVEDVTFSDTRGGTIPAFVVTPQSVKGRMPGIVFAPGAGQSRDTWMPELTALAKAGFTAMVTGVDYKPTEVAATDSTMVINGVLAQRRALDLLSRRDDTDPTRLAVVGHGWGGALMSVVAGLESRLSGVVLADVGSRFSLSMAASMKSDQKAYLDQLTRFDGARYLSQSGKRQVLMQFGTKGQSVPAAQAAELFTVTTGVKQRKDYDTGDDLVTPAAAIADRLAFFKKVLKVK
jgi:cephalosporin-C deacetylase-like acetyl esterase